MYGGTIFVATLRVLKGFRTGGWSHETLCMGDMVRSFLLSGFVRFAPKGTLQTTEELIKGADALALEGRKGLSPPMYLMVGKIGT